MKKYCPHGQHCVSSLPPEGAVAHVNLEAEAARRWAGHFSVCL